jgi:hypothetical protein
MQGVTSLDIKRALARRHGNREFFITECKNGPTGTGLLQFDGLAIYKSWAHPRIVGYEIKVSRSDFKRDAKFFTYLPYVHEFYFVVPTGLIDRMELPAEIGLMYYNPETGVLTTKKKATCRKIEVSADMLLYIIMTRLDSDRIPFMGDKAEYFRAWVEGKTNNRELGYQVSCKLLSEIRRLETEIERLRDAKECREEIDAIGKVMEEHGLSRYWKRAETLDRALSRSYPAELDLIQNQLQVAIKEIDKLKGKVVDKAG